MSSSSGEPQKSRRVSSNLCRSASASLGHLDRRRGDGSGTMTAGSCDDGCGGASAVGGRDDDDYGHGGHDCGHSGHGYGGGCDGGSASGGGGGGGHVLRRHQSEFGSLNCLHNRPRTLMESLLIAKMERASLNGGGGGHQYGSHPSLVRTDSIGSTSSLDSMSSMSSDLCRCDDCLLGISDLLYINTSGYEGRRRKVRHFVHNNS